jgi:osmotically-inducible protein OsmY
MPTLDKLDRHEQIEVDPTKSPSTPSILETATRKLRQQDFRFSRCVTCQLHEGVLLLRGRVPSYYLKQLAQTAVVGIKGVEQIDNRIDVYPNHNN